MDSARNTECMGTFAVYLWKYGMNQQHREGQYSVSILMKAEHCQE
jgi:hypothetical protein